MRVPWKTLMLLFFTLFMALGMSFKWQKSGNRPGYVSVGHLLSQMFFQSSLFMYVYVWFSATVKKVFPEKANILKVSGGKINAVHQTVSLKSQHRLENELEAELIHGLDERSHILESCWLQLLLLTLKESGRFRAGCDSTDCKEPEEAVQSPWQPEEALGKGRSPKGNIKTDVNKTIKDAGYYILLDKSHCDSALSICSLTSLVCTNLVDFTQYHISNLGSASSSASFSFLSHSSFSPLCPCLSYTEEPRTGHSTPAMTSPVLK